MDYSIGLQVIVGQHIRDRLLINTIADALKCGNVYKRANKDIAVLVINKF
jgi:hypothetical protein